MYCRIYQMLALGWQTIP